MIPKSLHTVTVIAAIARTFATWPDVPADQLDSMIRVAVHEALHVLGYADAPDAYGLADKARKVLAKEAQS